LKWNFLWERFVIWIHNKLSRKNLFAVDIANTGTDITTLPVFQDADIVHLHWVNQGLLSLKNIHKILNSGKPVVWTLHDMWPCTAVCHHAYECRGFVQDCSQCAYLRFPKCENLPHKVFLQKRQIYSKGNLHLVSVSNWLHQQVKRSALTRSLPSSVIPNTLSFQQFKMWNKEEACRHLNLPTNKFLIIFGAARIDDPIKGFPLLLKAIDLLISGGRYKKNDLHLVFFGKIKYPSQVLPNIPVAYTNLGWINNVEKLSVAYSATDAVVCASRYETFGQTLIEAQACGCLPVSFGNSGQTDIITHLKNGYLAEAYSVDDLANGIHWALAEGKKCISANDMREEVLHRYSSEVVAQQYMTLYENILKQGTK
jgi:glycosyltransferase involved in cell wall biosynthesis